MSSERDVLRDGLEPDEAGWVEFETRFLGKTGECLPLAELIALAVALAVVSPPLVTIGDAMLSEPLFGLLALGAVVSVLIARRSDVRSKRSEWTISALILVSIICSAASASSG